MSRMTAMLWLVMGVGLHSTGPAAAETSTVSHVPLGTAAPQAPVQARPVSQCLGDWLDQVDLQDITARQFIAWWSQATGIPMVVNWESLEAQGIDPQQPVTLRLHRLPAGHVLALGMQLISKPQAILMYEMTDGSLELLTKADANKRTVTRVYNVGSSLHLIDDRPLPRLNTSGYISTGRHGPGVIRMETRGRHHMTDRAATRLEAGEKLAQDLRDLIEPNLWREKGGEHGSIRFLQDRLIVMAPLYVQIQVAEFLGLTGEQELPAGGAGGASDPVDRPMRESRSNHQPISGVQPAGCSPISGVQGQSCEAPRAGEAMVFN